MNNIKGLSKGVSLVSVEFNTAVKYVTRKGFVNDFPITFEYDFEEYLKTFVGFKQRDDYSIVKVDGVDCVRFAKDLDEGTSVTIRRITPSGVVPHVYQDKGNAQGGAEFNAKTIDENFEYLSDIVEEIEEYNSITMDSLNELDDSFMTTQEVAKEALSTANRANAKADSAINTATKADEKADGAIAASDKAVKTSIIAEGKSDSAIVKADSAIETAQGADGSAKEAVRIAKIADTNSDQAIASSNQANETASKAVSYSSNAIEVADEAKAIAEGIDGKATEALEVSYRAETTATEASHTANNIAGTVEEANATSKEAWDMAKTALDTTTGDFIVQGLGNSTTKVISQKGTTDTLKAMEESTQEALTAKQDKLEFVGSGKVMREGASKFDYLSDPGEYYTPSNPVPKLKSGMSGLAQGAMFNVNSPELELEALGLKWAFMYFEVQKTYSGGDDFLYMRDTRGTKTVTATRRNQDEKWRNISFSYDSSNTYPDPNGFLKDRKSDLYALTNNKLTSDLDVDRTDYIASAKSAHDINKKAISAQNTANTAVTNAKTADDKAVKAQSTANTAVTNASTAQNRADSAYALAEKKIDKTAIANTLGNSTTLVASQKLVSDHGLGYGQEWVDVTSQRAENTTYANNTGKPIEIAIEIGGTVQGAGGRARLLVGSVQFQIGAYGSSGTGSASVIIPNGESYQISSLDNAVIKKWIELRG